MTDPKIDNGSKTPSERFKDLEDAVKDLNVSASEWSLAKKLLLTLAAILPLAVLVDVLLRKGTDGSPGTPGVSVPVGGIIAWPGRFQGDEDGYWSREDGSVWRVCDGGEVKLNEYPALLAAFGDAKGWPYAQDASSLTLPDLRGRFPMGVISAEAIGDDGGVSHLTFNTTSRRAAGGEGPALNYIQALEVGDDSSEDRWKMTVNDDGNEKRRFDIRPPFLAVHWLIRVK